MATNLATAYVSIVPSMRGVQGQLMKELVPAVGPASEKAGQSAGSRLVNGMKKTAMRGAVAAGAGIAGVLSVAVVKGFQRLSAIENAEAKLRGLGHSAQEVAKIMESALASVKGTSFGMDEAATTAASAVAAGIKPGKELTSYLSLVADAATIGGVSMAEMGQIFNKVATSGKVQGEVFNQLGEKGIPVIQLLADELGVTAAEVYKLGSDGKIGTEQFLAAMSSMEGAALSAGNTTTGATKNLMAAVSRFGAELLSGVFPLIGPTFGKLTDYVDTATAAVGPLAEVVAGELAGGFRALLASFQASRDGILDITSTGFPGFMEHVGNAAGVTVTAFQAVHEWLRENSTMIGSVVLVLGTMTAGFYANAAATALAGAAAGLYSAALSRIQSAAVTAALKVMYLNAALLANPVGIVIALLAGLVVAIVLAWRHSETFRNIVMAVWDGIKAAASAVVGWFVGSAFPWLQNGLSALGGVFRWILDSVVRPVWNGIKFIVAVNVAILMTIWDGIAWVIRNTLGRLFMWLWRDVIVPAWNGIKNAINFAWTAIRDVVFRPLADFLQRVLVAAVTNFLRNITTAWTTIRGHISAVWSAIRDNVLRPFVNFLDRILGDAFRNFVRNVRRIWDDVSGHLRDGWAVIRDRVLKPFAGFIDGTLGEAFRKGLDGIRKMWDGLKKAVSAPVEAVINTVINKGFIKNFNTIARKFGIKEMDEVEFKGFRKGGRTGGVSPDEVRGYVHGKEFVSTAERTAEADRMAPGFLDDFHRHGFAAAASKHFNGANMAPGAFLPSYGVGSWTGGLRSAIFRTGRMNVAGAAPGYDLSGALGMLDRATRVKVARGPAGQSNSVHVRAMNYPAWWAGYQSGNDVMLNNAVAGGMPARSKRVLLAHELGHALGLPHNARMHGGNGAPSMMNYDNMYAHGSVTSADVRALSAIYGGSGFASGGGDAEDERPGMLSRLGDWLKKAVGFDKLLDKIPGGPFMKDLMVGAAKEAWSGFQSFAKKAMEEISLGNLAKKLAGFLGIGGAAAGDRPTVFDGGGWLEKTAAPQLTWHRENKPDAVLTNDELHMFKAAAANEGGPRRDAPLVGTLNALDMDEALRKLRDAEKMKEALHK